MTAPAKKAARKAPARKKTAARKKAAAKPEQSATASVAEGGETQKGSLTRVDSRTLQTADLIRQDRSMQLVNGMFVVGGNPNIRLTAQQQYMGVELTYRFSPMGAFPLRVLHALAAMLQVSFRGEITSFSIEDLHNAKPGAEAAWSQMGKGAPAFGQFLTTIRTSSRQLAEAVGEDTSGPALRRVYEALKQLSEVMIHMKNSAMDTEVSTPLIQVARQGTGIVIIVNPRMVKTVAQRTVGAFTVFSLAEMRTMSTMRGESLLLLYNGLCARIDPGATLMFGQDKLELYVWGSVLETSPETRESRKGRVRALRKALQELESFGWKVIEKRPARGQRGEKPVYTITRPDLTSAQRRQLEQDDAPAQQLTLLPD